MTDALRILIGVYACGPGQGSEAGLGWNVPAELARRGHDVTVLTLPAWREGIEAELAERPVPGLRFFYVRERDAFLRLGWTVGSALRYLEWQARAAHVGARLHERLAFDVVHHVSYGTLLGGSQLWRVGPPFVFGPVGGGQKAPAAFSAYFGRTWRSEAARSAVVAGGWRALPWLAPLARATRLVLAGNPETAELARRAGFCRVELLLDVGLPAAFAPPEPLDRSGHSGPLRLLWVGRLMPRKALRLAVEALDLVDPACDVELHVVGGAIPTDSSQEWVEARPHVHPVVFHGTLDWEAVKEHYSDADVFLFTSLRDSCGVQVLEAMAWGLPVVALWHQGAGVLVPEDGGVKVPVGTPGETARGLARAIEALASDAGERSRAGAVNHAAAAAYAWSAKAARLEGLYRDVLTPALVGREEQARVNGLQIASEHDDFTPERYTRLARHLPPGARDVLDVGCGVGRGGAALLAAVPGAALTGLDIVPERLERVPPGVYQSTVCAHATEVPLPSASFDAVVAGEFIEHLDEGEVDAVLDEMRRLLRPGGRLLLTTPHPGGLRWRLRGVSPLDEPSHLSVHPPEELASRLRAHGFRVLTIEGSGRVTRYVGAHVRPLSVYGSYLAVAGVADAGE